MITIKEMLYVRLSDLYPPRANDMLTVLDALIPILLKNIVTDRKLEIKDIRNIVKIMLIVILKVALRMLSL